jgi:hypothetical protein
MLLTSALCFGNQLAKLCSCGCDVGWLISTAVLQLLHCLTASRQPLQVLATAHSSRGDVHTAGWSMATETASSCLSGACDQGSSSNHRQQKQSEQCQQQEQQQLQQPVMQQQAEGDAG